MFDSSKQPLGQDSTIDFLHQTGSRDSKPHSSQSRERVELTRIDPKIADRANARTNPFLKQIVASLVHWPASLIRASGSLFRSKPTAPTVAPVRHAQPSAIKHEAENQKINDLPANDKARESIAHIELPISPSPPKSKSLGKIPLDQFRDADRTERAVDKAGLAKRGETPRGISFHHDHDPEHKEFDVNLLPEQRRGVSSRTKRGIGISMLSLEFIALLVGFLAIQARADGRLLGLRELESQQTLLDIQTKQYREVVKEATNLQQQAAALKRILENRADVTEVFAWFESHTVDSVSYEQFSFSNSGEVRVHVVTSSVVDAAHQMNLFNTTDAWRSVELSGIVFNADKKGTLVVEFDASFAGFMRRQQQPLP